MLWCKYLVASLLVGVSSAALLPDQLSGIQRTGVESVAIPDSSLWTEYGHQASEKASYGSITISASRFQDTTGAFAALQLLRGAAQQPGVLSQYGNYILRFEGTPADEKQIRELGAKLPGVVRSSLPSLPGYLPAANQLSGTDRYILGPVSLARFEPRLTPALVAFEKGAEAQIASYKAGPAELHLMVVSYPTPQIAIERLRQYERIEGLLARRSGPMLAVVPNALEARSAAETLLSGFSYAPRLMWNEKAPEDPRNVGVMFLSIFTLAGFLVAGSIIFGLFLGGIRRVFARSGVSAIDGSFTSLNLGGHETTSSL